MAASATSATTNPVSSAGDIPNAATANSADLALLAKQERRAEQR